MSINSDLGSIRRMLEKAPLKTSRLWMNKHDYDDILKWNSPHKMLQELLDLSVHCGKFDAERAADFIMDAEVALDRAYHEVPQSDTFELQVEGQPKQIFDLRQTCQILDNHRYMLMGWPAAMNIVIVRKVMEV